MRTPVLLGALALAGCGGGSSETVEAPPPATTTPMFQPQPDRSYTTTLFGQTVEVDPDAIPGIDDGSSSGFDDAFVRAEVAAFNEQSASLKRSFARSGGGTLDCAVSTAQDFPDSTLITIISSTGAWLQAIYRDGSPVEGGFREGSDYSTWIYDWQAFKNATGVGCTVNPETGRLTLS